MSRRPNVIRPTLLHVNIDEDLRARLDLFLFSEIEGRIPKGAYKAFLEARIREFFERMKDERSTDS